MLTSSPLTPFFHPRGSLGHSQCMLMASCISVLSGWGSMLKMSGHYKPRSNPWVLSWWEMRIDAYTDFLAPWWGSSEVCCTQCLGLQLHQLQMPKVITCSLTHPLLAFLLSLSHSLNLSLYFLGSPFNYLSSNLYLGLHSGGNPNEGNPKETWSSPTLA